MENTLKIDEETARRLYPTAAPEFKEMLEKNFGKEFFSQKNPHYIKICNEIGINPEDDGTVVVVKDFTEREINCVKSFIKKLRVSKWYRKGKLPKKGDNRYYYWHRLGPSAPSGLVFSDADYDDGRVRAASASHLCLLNEADARDMAEKFRDIDADFYDLR